MRGASLRSVTELLGHQSMKMTMRYAHLSPAFLSAEVRLLDPAPSEAGDSAELKLRPTDIAEPQKSKRARKGQSESRDTKPRSEAPEFVEKFGSPRWTISATGFGKRRDLRVFRHYFAFLLQPEIPVRPRRRESMGVP
jgi:hypothetical protein